LLIGTTALLFRKTGAFDLVVVDEEQKFSVQQREQLLGYDGHHLTSSATCIPRSQALARFGAISVSELRENHTPKNIETRLWTAQDRATLQGELRAYLRGGGQLLIVYPMKDDSTDGDVATGEAASAGTKWSVANAATHWEALYPGRVRALTGEDTDDTKTAVMADMRENRAQILLATSLVETGVNLPGLRRVMIVMPDRFGLTQLHQLRGRAARLGGEGECDLYAPTPLSPKALERITRFLTCRTGFEVAELDLQLRGCGDLGRGSLKQSGADDTFVYGTALTVDLLESVRELWEQLGGGGAKAPGPMPD
jgi:ATP-dependent DNA helicase RecG